jgi:hypothetical protein
MAQPILPPRGFFIPTHMIFKSQMPPAVFLTWLQLRSLTWCGPDIPPFSVQAWVDLTGISRCTFLRHLKYLQDLDALHWHSSGYGRIRIKFNNPGRPIHLLVQEPEKTGSISEQTCCSKMDSSKMNSSKMNNPPSLNHPVNIDTLPIPVLKLDYQKSKHNPVEEGEGGGKRECEGERGYPLSQNCETQGARTPVYTYLSLVHHMPNNTQQCIIDSMVTDINLWQQTLEHWLGHGWNPRNITGILQLYERGGASGCRSCYGEKSASSQRKTTHQQTIDAFESLRNKRTNPLNQD